MDDVFFDIKSLKGKKIIDGVDIKSVFLKGVMMTYMEFEPNSILPEHSHLHEQITFIIQGEMELDIDGNTKRLSEGEGAIIPSYVKHKARVFDKYTIAIDAWSPVREDYKI